jgi:hypothetical protein
MSTQAESRFRIVFVKLAELMGSEEQTSASDVALEELSQQEAMEIAELRRLVLEVSEPERICYTST